MKFVQVTDLHIVPAGATLLDLDPRERLCACIADINEHCQDARFCVFTGDLGDRGRSENYSVLRECLEKLELPYHLMLGNHDRRAPFYEIFPDAPRDENGFAQFHVHTEAGWFLFLDTLDEGRSPGLYCDKRRAWLAQRLRDAGSDPVYLFMHHPPFDLNFPCIDNIGLAEQQAFAEILRPYANIRHLFFGHAHRPISGNWLGISFSSLRGTNHQVDLNFNSEEIHYNSDPPEYSIVFIEDDRVVVHTHAYPLEVND